MYQVTYLGQGLVSVGGDTFCHAVPPPEDNDWGTPPVYKSEILIRQLEVLVARIEPRRIVELGIYRGGSVALLAAMCEPERLVAIELNAREQVMLTEYLVGRGWNERVVPYYGVDQADPVVTQILADEFAGQPVDLVIDDASHLYAPSRASFEMIFPSVASGGVYVIEDWAAQHTLVATVVDAILRRKEGWREQVDRLGSEIGATSPELASRLGVEPDDADVVAAARAAEALRGAEPLSRLGIEILHLVAGSRDIVRRVEVSQGWIEITRGDEPIEREDWFDYAAVDYFGSLTAR